MKVTLTEGIKFSLNVRSPKEDFNVEMDFSMGPVDTEYGEGEFGEELTTSAEVAKSLLEKGAEMFTAFIESESTKRNHRTEGEGEIARAKARAIDRASKAGNHEEAAKIAAGF